MEKIWKSRFEVKMKILKKEYNVNILPTPTIRIALLGENAGTVHCYGQGRRPDIGCVNPHSVTRCEIIISPHVLSEFKDEAIMACFLHEYAHLICTEKSQLNCPEHLRISKNCTNRRHCLIFKKVCVKINGIEVPDKNKYKL